MQVSCRALAIELITNFGKITRNISTLLQINFVNFLQYYTICTCVTTQSEFRNFLCSGNKIQII